MKTKIEFTDMNQANLWINKNIGPKDKYQLIDRFGKLVLIVSKFKDRDPYARTFYR